ncbi:hypothetical protein GCM10011391_19720 [Pullulanibacillus camelliae]|uniref:Uncharacterized protein n=1 Tax=Pullulanibacillus camelliae TaxID=1707096 RepID=A0A8J2VUX5_9BACL|nr:hypothetical protein GCM10011391_19720 [Pullulanibacillus camelliae]
MQGAGDSQHSNIVYSRAPLTHNAILKSCAKSISPRSTQCEEASLSPAKSKQPGAETDTILSISTQKNFPNGKPEG